MHRFFISPNTINNQHFSTTDKELCHQINKVLKMKGRRSGSPLLRGRGPEGGDIITFCDNTEHEYLAEWITVSRSICEAKIIEKNFIEDIGTRTSVHIYVPPLKNQNRFELILEKCTELGVASIIPIITERTEVTEIRKAERLHRIIKEAAEQSGRTKLTEFGPPIKFSTLLEMSPKKVMNSINLIANLNDQTTPILEALKKGREDTKKFDRVGIQIFIGPVGDFTEMEVKEALEHNFYSVSLGSQILRTETAAIVASSLILADK